MVVSDLIMVVTFLVGVALVMYSVELFIDAASRSAVSLGISGFFIAVLLAGIDLENAVLGVTAAYTELPDLALGTVFGEALFVLAVAVGLAGVLIPFDISVSWDYLLLLLLVPIPVFALSLSGTLNRLTGIALTAVFFPLLGYFYWKEARTETEYMISQEVEEIVELDDDDDDEEVEFLDIDELLPDLSGLSGPFQLFVAVVATVGLTVGSLITVVSAEQLLAAYGISELAFGATVLSFIASIEELALTVEPVRRGRSELALGNIVGSTVFYMTANVGLIAIFHPIDTGGAVMTVQWPFFAIGLLAVFVMLVRGSVSRLGGYLLLGLYLAYWGANYLL